MPAAQPHRPGKHRDAGLTAEDLLDMFWYMLLSRALDQRIWVLNRQGKVPISGPSAGHEGAQVGSVWALRRGVDYLFPYYRDMAALLALGVSPSAMLMSHIGKAGGAMSGGRQFPMHGAIPELRVISLSNVVATQIPQAVGAALALRMRREEAAVLTYFGDGATSQGDCHEGMNFASVHRLPIVFFCENNRYAISVPQHRQMAVQDVAVRAQGYGFPGVVVDGTDPVEVYRVTREALERARRGEGPTLIEAKVERLMPHTPEDDPSRYRSPEDMERARARDPIPLFRAYLMAEGLLTEEQDREIQARVQKEVDRATEEADSAPFPEPATLYHHLYASPPNRRA